MNNQELDINIDTYPITLNYNSNDLNENKTGFLPVNISVSNPNFVQLYADKYWPNTDPEVPDDQPHNHIFNQPIQFNGKYKFIPFESPPGSFPVSGYIPQYMTDQNSTNWDLNINVPQTQTITLKGIAGGLSSTTIIQFNEFTLGTGDVSIPNGRIIVYIKPESTYYNFRLIANSSGNAITKNLNNDYYYIGYFGGDQPSIIDNNNEKILKLLDGETHDNTGFNIYLYKNIFTIDFN